MHRPVVETIIVALQEIFETQKYADKIIEKNLKSNRKWGARDRRFFAESVYECVRWWKKYWFLLDEEPNTFGDRLFLLFGVHIIVSAGDEAIPDWIEFDNLDVGEIKNRMTMLDQAPIDIQTSMPKWLCDLTEKEMGAEKSVTILKALNEKAPVDLRCNTLKTKRKELEAQLITEGVQNKAIDHVPEGVTLRERKNVFITEAFKKGFFEVQDRASQKVAPFLKVEPGHRVVDACAGAGGKSLHLAALMKNKGKIISLDIFEWKLKELRQRASRAGVDIIEVRVIDSQKVIKRLVGTADRLLLDVPCSGIGVLRRNPDSKWKLNQEELTRLNLLQREILNDYCEILKPGGMMVYSTCSFLPSENEKQVEWFLEQKGPGWKLEKSLRINPDDGLGDGFFAALISRSAAPAQAAPTT